MTRASAPIVRHSVERSSSPTPMTSTIDSRYMPNTTLPALEPKNVAPTRTNTVRRALHAVKGTSKDVSTR